MKHPVRIILKKVKTDSNGQLIDSDYVTVDIDNKEIESLLFNPMSHIAGQYHVVGAELLNKSKLQEEHMKSNELIPF